MNQLRFSIGVPKAGSAARIAEDSAGMASGSIRPRAGSAARDAEERNRMGGVTAQRPAAIRLRAQGMRVAEPVELHAQAPIREDAVAAGRGAATSATSTGLREDVVEESTFSRPLQTAAVHIKSLVQSLFSHGDSSSKS